jgi:hypothetical protein
LYECAGVGSMLNILWVVAMFDVVMERLLNDGRDFWTKRDRVNWNSDLPEMDIQTQLLPQR